MILELVDCLHLRVVDAEFPLPLFVTTALSVKLCPGVRFPLGLLVGVLTTKSGATAVVEYATVQSSSPCELLARIRIVPEVAPVGVPLNTRVPVLKLIPLGSEPTTA